MCRIMSTILSFHPHTHTHAHAHAHSLWLQPVAGSNGVLVAKTTGGGSTRFYVLALVADGGSFIIRLSYLPASLQVRLNYLQPLCLRGDVASHGPVC